MYSPYSSNSEDFFFSFLALSLPSLFIRRQNVFHAYDLNLMQLPFLLPSPPSSDLRQSTCPRTKFTCFYGVSTVVCPLLLDITLQNNSWTLSCPLIRVFPFHISFSRLVCLFRFCFLHTFLTAFPFFVSPCSFPNFKLLKPRSFSPLIGQLLWTLFDSLFLPSLFFLCHPLLLFS